MKKRSLIAGLAIITAILGGVALAAPAEAASASCSGAARDQCTMLNKTVTKNSVNKSKLYGRCVIGTTGSTCTIAKGKSVSNTWGLALGASKSWLSGQLSVSVTSSSSVSVACTSPALPKGAQYSAYPYGTKWTYKIKESIAGVNTTSTHTSGTLTSWKTNPAILWCGRTA